MKQPLISKHIRMKILRTPLLQTLISYSKKSTTPKKEHLDNICRVLQTIPQPEQSSYTNILNMSLNSPNKNLSPILRTKSTKCTLSRSRVARLVISPQKESKSQFKLSQQTKNLAINLNKHKLDEEESFLKPQYVTQQLSKTSKTQHKFECNCVISEVAYQNHCSQLLTYFKIFVSCRSAASDFPQLITNNIYSILSIGEEPNNFPSIRGGYKNIQFDGNFSKLVAPVFAFLSSQILKGNVLVCDETGRGPAFVMLMCYVMKFFKVGFDSMLEIMKSIKGNLNIGLEEESFIRDFDHHKMV